MILRWVAASASPMTADKTITYETCNKCKAEAGGKVIFLPSEKQLLREATAREVYLRAQIRNLEEQLLKLKKTKLQGE